MREIYILVYLIDIGNCFSPLSPKVLHRDHLKIHEFVF